VEASKKKKERRGRGEVASPPLSRERKGEKGKEEKRGKSKKGESSTTSGGDCRLRKTEGKKRKKNALKARSARLFVPAAAPRWMPGKGEGERGFPKKKEDLNSDHVRPFTRKFPA